MVKALHLHLSTCLHSEFFWWNCNGLVVLAELRTDTDHKLTTGIISWLKAVLVDIDAISLLLDPEKHLKLLKLLWELLNVEGYFQWYWKTSQVVCLVLPLPILTNDFWTKEELWRSGQGTDSEMTTKHCASTGFYILILLQPSCDMLAWLSEMMKPRTLAYKGLYGHIKDENAWLFKPKSSMPDVFVICPWNTVLSPFKFI